MLNLTVLSPEKKVADKIQVKSVTLPGSEGQIQVFPEHAHMVGTLETGPFAYELANGSTVIGVISHGFFEVKNDEISVMAETCELATDIDASRARTAQKKAEGALIDPQLDPKNFRKYELKLQRALIRQQIAGSTSLPH